MISYQMCIIALEQKESNGMEEKKKGRGGINYSFTGSNMGHDLQKWSVKIQKVLPWEWGKEYTKQIKNITMHEHIIKGVIYANNAMQE